MNPEALKRASKGNVGWVYIPNKEIGLCQKKLIVDVINSGISPIKDSVSDSIV